MAFLLQFFGHISEARERQLRAIHEQDVAKDAEKAKKDADERESELRSKYNDDLEMRKRWDKEYIQEAEEDALKKSEQKTKELLESRKQNSEKLRRVENELNEKYSLEIENLKKEQKTELEKHKTILNSSQQELISTKKELVIEKNQLCKICNEASVERTVIENVNNANQAKATENHQDIMIELKTKLKENTIEKEKAKLELEEKNRKQQEQYTRESHELEEAKLMSSQQLMNAINSEKEHVEFWDKCINIITLFNKFKTQFNNEEISILKSIRDMKHGNELIDTPQLGMVSKYLQNFLEELQPLLSSTEHEIGELSDKTLKKTEKLKMAINQITSKIGIYERKQNLGNEEVSKKIATDVITLHTLARELIKELSESMIEFNIPEPKLFSKTLHLQSQLLSKNLRSTAITNGAPRSLAIEKNEIGFS